MTRQELDTMIADNTAELAAKRKASDDAALALLKAKSEMQAAQEAAQKAQQAQQSAQMECAKAQAVIDYLTTLRTRPQ